MAYGFHNRTDTSKTIMIFDLGGGTFDVSLLTVNNGMLTVLATGGDTHLGGEDFDNTLVSFCVDRFQSSSGIDISKNARALRRLRTEVEKAKRTLSSSLKTEINCDSLAEGEDFVYEITKAKFEELCDHYFKKCITHVE